MNGRDPSGRGRRQNAVSGDAHATARATQWASQEHARTLSETLRQETDRLQNVLGVLNQSVAHFCHTMNEQSDAMGGRLEQLTASLNKASGSSSRLGWILIFVTAAWLLMTLILGLPSAVKGYKEIFFFQPTVQQPTPAPQQSVPKTNP